MSTTRFTTKQQLTLHLRQITYTLIRSTRARHMRLSISHAGDFAVTVPQHMNLHFIERHLLQKSDWILKTLARANASSGHTFLKSTKTDFNEQKGQALALATERTRYFNAVYQFTFHSIRIKNQSTRWGSCSKKGNLNFNYHLVHLPIHLVDYIVIHELCHLGELNHSKKFWALVAKTAPHHAQLRKELRTYRMC